MVARAGSRPSAVREDGKAFVKQVGFGEKCSPFGNSAFFFFLFPLLQCVYTFLYSSLELCADCSSYFPRAGKEVALRNGSKVKFLTGKLFGGSALTLLLPDNRAIYWAGAIDTAGALHPRAFWGLAGSSGNVCPEGAGLGLPLLGASEAMLNLLLRRAQLYRETK